MWQKIGFIKFVELDKNKTFGIKVHEILIKMLSDQQMINFIKDHDYVEVVDASGRVAYSFDPSVYDLTWLDFSE